MSALSDRDLVALDFRAARRVVQSLETSWSGDVTKRLSELVGLSVGWDGYTGRPVDFAIACFAHQLTLTVCVHGAPCPSLVPGSDGTLQVEWHAGGFDIELDILAVNKVRAWRADARTGREDELELSVDFAAVYQWMTEMRDRLNADAVVAAA
jgi:hypothetical protein